MKLLEASKSLIISNGKNDTAWLTAGLANWRRGDLKSEIIFYKLGLLENSRGSFVQLELIGHQELNSFKILQMQ